jgi:hypothetical protein
MFRVPRSVASVVRFIAIALNVLMFLGASICAGTLASITPLVDELQRLGFRLAAKTRDAVLKLAGE